MMRHLLIKGVGSQSALGQALDACQVKPSLVGCLVRYIGDPGAIWG